jgi:hypothetical protein
MKATKTIHYMGGRMTERPEAIQKEINEWEEMGWRVKSIIVGMAGMWVVYERDQK